MYYKDLSPYVYQRSLNKAVNVGWLSKSHTYPKGIVSDEFLVKLKELAKKGVSLCRGSHACEFCDKDPPRGNGEIHVMSDGVEYHAPVLIVHYVEAHYYKPPDEFIRAVLA